MSSPENPPIDERFDGLVSELRAAPACGARRPSPARGGDRGTACPRPPEAARDVGARSSGSRSRRRSDRRRRRCPAVTTQTAAAAVGAARRARDQGFGHERRDALHAGRRSRRRSARSSIRRRSPSASRICPRRPRMRCADTGSRRLRAHGRLRRGRRGGTARLVVRVPIGRVQTAILRFSELGTILDQHVSVRDVQPRLDRRFARIAELRRGDSDALRRRAGRCAGRARGAADRAGARRRQASFATVVARPDDHREEASFRPPGRIERALERAADVLAAETRGGRVRGCRRCAVHPARPGARIAVRAARSRSDKPPARLLERLWR